MVSSSQPPPVPPRLSSDTSPPPSTSGPRQWPCELGSDRDPRGRARRGGGSRAQGRRRWDQHCRSRRYQPLAARLRLAADCFALNGNERTGRWVFFHHVGSQQSYFALDGDEEWMASVWTRAGTDANRRRRWACEGSLFNAGSREQAPTWGRGSSGKWRRTCAGRARPIAWRR